ncbi:38836_t:CDS:1 [Gigaspora margarita]|uniref:38836_t:CDS:1 n=2 Tax=Gigaspora margarita TaxID=4874 RepID=A0ABM8W2V5_GIGMA|nr:Clathrin heavy chain [Gigaspora margarita]CAG8510706.1 38836_t:CDS:1 [Gigaspora margarita]
MAFAVSSPLPSDYVQADPRMFFSFHPNNTSFQRGFLGISHTTISGTFHVRFPQAIEAKNISLTFLGREIVEWADLKKVRAEKIIVNKSAYIWQTTSDLGHELITDLDLPFEFEIPDDAIESFITHYGKVEYTLKAIINRKPKKKTSSVEVLVPIYKWTIPDEQELRLLVIKSRAKNRKLPLSWEAILPKTFFDINSEVMINLRLTSHDPDLRIRKIVACLKTFTKYAIDDYGISPMNRDKRHPKYRVQGKDIIMTPTGPDTVFETNVIIKIPNDVAPTCKTKYMSIKNQIQIKVFFERFHHHVMIIRDVVVGRNFLNDRCASIVRDSMISF